MLSITPVLHAITHWGDTCADRLPPHGKVCMGRALTTAVFQAPSPAHCALTRLIIYYLPPPRHMDLPTYSSALYRQGNRGTKSHPTGQWQSQGSDPGRLAQSTRL